MLLRIADSEREKEPWPKSVGWRDRVGSSMGINKRQTLTVLVVGKTAK